MWKRKLILAAVTTAIFILLLTGVDPRAAWSVLRSARIDILMAAAALTLTFPLLSALRWQWIMRRLDAPISFWDSLKLIMAAWPLGAVTPAKSGDLIKAVFLRHRLPAGQTAGIVLAERLIDVGVLSACACAGGFWLGRTAVAGAGAAILLAAAGGFALAASGWTSWLPGRLHPLADDVALAARRVYASPKALALILFITMVNWFGSYVQTWLCYRSLGAPVPLGQVCAALPIAIFAGLLPITISGMGTRDGAMILLFQGYAAYETNLAVGVLYSIYGYWLLALLGIPFMRAAFAGRIAGVDRDELRQAAIPSD
ncbi:MAG: flippase-like domain-containing protein [bacterium]|nr:flippase-like domain-containing protein [bacterium]